MYAVVVHGRVMARTNVRHTAYRLAAAWKGTVEYGL